MKVYISGPISASNRPDKNRPAFERAAKLLAALGHKPLSPFNNGLHESAAWLDHMRADIHMLMGADGVATLDGWGDSRGAKIEVGLAESLGLRVDPLSVWLLEVDLPELIEAGEF